MPASACKHDFSSSMPTIRDKESVVPWLNGLQVKADRGAVIIYY